MSSIRLRDRGCERHSGCALIGWISLKHFSKEKSNLKAFKGMIRLKMKIVDHSSMTFVRGTLEKGIWQNFWFILSIRADDLGGKNPINKNCDLKYDLKKIIIIPSLLQLFVWQHDLAKDVLSKLLIYQCDYTTTTTVMFFL